MIELRSSQDLARIRRIVLSAQGLLQSRSYGTGFSGAVKAINHIGYVQIDSISVVERAHHHVLHSRVPGFESFMTNKMLLNGDIFEYWTHAAAFIPVADFRFSLPFKHAIKNGQTHWFKKPDKKLMGELLTRVRLDGPIRSRDLESGVRKATGWWDWKPAKKALEQLYMQGDLMVCDREGFQKSYDLTERVLPGHVSSLEPSLEEFAAHLLDQQLRCHGLTSLKGLTYLRKNTELRKAVKTLVYERLAERALEQVRLSSGEVFFLKAGSFECSMPKVNKRMLILSPFDNSVIQRERLKAIFHYDYQMECYVPAAKRQYGYFCLPLLYGDTFIGRMDCKVHRKNGHLEIKHLHFENHGFDQEIITAAFLKAIKSFSVFQNCNSISLLKAHPKVMLLNLQSRLKSLN